MDAAALKEFAQDSNIQGYLNARDLYCVRNNISVVREQEDV